MDEDDEGYSTDDIETRSTDSYRYSLKEVQRMDPGTPIVRELDLEED